VIFRRPEQQPQLSPQVSLSSHQADRPLRLRRGPDPPLLPGEARPPTGHHAPQGRRGRRGLQVRPAASRDRRRGDRAAALLASDRDVGAARFYAGLRLRGRHRLRARP